MPVFRRRRSRLYKILETFARGLLFQTSSRNRRLDFADGLGDLDFARTGQGTVKDGMAAVDAKNVIQYLEPFGCSAVATVKDEAVGGDDGRRADILVVGPEGGTGGGTASTQDALGGVVEALAVFLALIAFLRRFGFIVDEPGLHGAVVLEERFHVHDQVFDDAQAENRLDGDFRAGVAHQRLARQAVEAVDAHRIRPADAVCARTAEGERPVLVALDLFEQIQHAVGGIGLQFVCFVRRLLVLFGVVAEDFECDFHGGILCCSVLGGR